MAQFLVKVREEHLAVGCLPHSLLKPDRVNVEDLDVVCQWILGDMVFLGGEGFRTHMMMLC